MICGTDSPVVIPLTEKLLYLVSDCFRGQVYTESDLGREVGKQKT